MNGKKFFLFLEIKKFSLPKEFSSFPLFWCFLKKISFGGLKNLNNLSLKHILEGVALCLIIDKYSDV